jgi:hypothetical protein
MSADYTEMVLTMGGLLGQLRREALFNELVASLKAGQLNPDYLALLRDKLNEALVRSAD